MTLSPKRAVSLARSGTWQHPADRISLTYEGRFLRRRRLETEGGADILADLPETVSLGAGDALVLEDGSLVEVVAAPEDLAQVRGGNLARLAWHIGNRHTPCQIEAGRLLIARDHVLEAMLGQLGAKVDWVTEPFTPEGGAYGHGRTLGHSHGTGHEAGHGAGHGAGPAHAHGHGEHDHAHAGRRVHHHGSHLGQEAEAPEPDV